MNGVDENERLPSSIGGLIRFALAGWASAAPLYLALAAGVFAAYAATEIIVPDASITSQQGQFKLYVLEYAGLFADAFVIAAVALGIGARSLGKPVTAATLAGGATDRWLPVIAVTLLSQSVVLATGYFSGLGPPPQNPLVFVIAPFVWILWGILGLTGPFVALPNSRTPLTVMIGFTHAFTASLRRVNIVRLCVLALITVIPQMIPVVLLTWLVQHHLPRPIFWANAPVDAVTIGPLTAIQTAFALDFARRANRVDRPPS